MVEDPSAVAQIAGMLPVEKGGIPADFSPLKHNNPVVENAAAAISAAGQGFVSGNKSVLHGKCTRHIYAPAKILVIAIEPEIRVQGVLFNRGRGIGIGRLHVERTPGTHIYAAALAWITAATEDISFNASASHGEHRIVR